MLPQTGRNAVSSDNGLYREAVMAVRIVWFPSPEEALSALRRGAEDSIFEYLDTVRAVVEASKDWGFRQHEVAYITAAESLPANRNPCAHWRNRPPGVHEWACGTHPNGWFTSDLWQILQTLLPASSLRRTAGEVETCDSALTVGYL